MSTTLQAWDAARARVETKRAIRDLLSRHNAEERVGLLADILADLEGAPPERQSEPPKAPAPRPPRARPPSGSAGAERKFTRSDPACRLFPGETTRQVGERIAAFVRANPGTQSAALASQFERAPLQMTHFLGKVKALGLIRSTGTRHGMRYFAP